MNTKKHRLLSMLLWSGVMLLTSRCIEPFEIKGLGGNTNILVVDASVTTPDNTAFIKLSRTLPVDSIGTFAPETNANVYLEDNNGNQAALSQMTPGTYASTGLDLNAGKQYKLMIQIGQEKYESDFVTPQKNVEFDSVVWRVEDDQNISINVNAHGAITDPRYFKYTFSETWRYSARFYSSFIMTAPGEVRLRENDEINYFCYKGAESRAILVTSTKQLTTNQVQNFKIQNLEIGTIKLSSAYTSLVRQTTISAEEYNYLVDVRNSTSPEGGLFDPQPGEVIGNIRCVSDPDEPVIGFFGIGSVSEKRIFIRNSDLPTPFRIAFRDNCDEEKQISLAELAESGNVYFVTSSYGMPGIEGYYYSTYSCTDCRAKGGVTAKPDYFPQ